MIAVLQRVREARVEVGGAVVGAIEQGFLVLVCAEPTDTEATAERLVAKVLKLRVFSDDAGKMNRSVQDVGGGLLIVSQFTLAASLAKGNRPSFEPAEVPARAETLYLRVVAQLRQAGLNVETGRFGADMAVELVNDGPVTFLVFTRGGRLVQDTPASADATG